jgi:superfamily II DNA or RNA helicase
MLKDCDWSIDRDYKTGSEEDPMQFYLEGLTNSIEFSLLLGYFSSSAISLLSVGFASFISRGGKMRMVINHVLSEKDKEVIYRVEEGPDKIKVFDLSDVVSLGKTLDEYGTHFFECLAYLIRERRIEIKIIKPKNGKGIAHYKSGVFNDGVDSVGYQASCNFTYYGLSENIEQLEAFLSWENGRSNKMIKKQIRTIDDYFSESDEDVEYLTSKDIEVVLKDRFGKVDIDELLVREDELLRKKQSLIQNNTRLKNTINKICSEIETIRRMPRFPYSEGPREYQVDAYNNWVQNNYKGIFAMATGTGKTITALNCVLSEFNKKPKNTYHVLILVPTITLVEQWGREVSSFNFQEIYKVSSKVNWQNEVVTLISTAKRIPVSFVIISTYASFVKDKFQSLIKDLPEDTLFIADEGHNLASPTVSSSLINFKLERRIGLSATPKRKYDFEGTAAMELFFNDKEPYTYSFSMEKAIKEGVLCEYYYYPHIVKLTSIEMTEYVEISNQIAKLYRLGKENPEKDSIIERLLLKRKRIVHKAENKLEATVSILEKQFVDKGNLKYTFVYVPEGETFEIKEEDEDLVTENIRLINQYTREIAKLDNKILVNQFVSGMTDRDDILQQFQKGEIDVIASMKCLDEGVDIPRAETAIFCSSTGNPRQFIQRRGRILRKHPEKKYAVIHDLVIIPEVDYNEDDMTNFELEKKLVKSELERVMYFASLSRNPFFTEEVFDGICKKYNLNIYLIQQELALT